jgi:hypothetical protein
MHWNIYNAKNDDFKKLMWKLFLIVFLIFNHLKSFDNSKLSYEFF